MIRLLIAFLVTAATAAYAQDPADDPVPEPYDSTWSHPDSAWQDTEQAWRDIEQTDPSELDFSDVVGDFSRGWFPRMHRGSALSYFGEMFYADVHDRGNGIRSRSLVPTTAAYDWHDPFDDDEREILEPNTDEEADDSYPVTDYTEYGLSYSYNLPMPLQLRAAASLRMPEGMLFAHDTSRSYLALSGIRRPLKEVSVVYLKQYQLAAAGGISIPIYGAYINSEFVTVGSYYYLHLGGSISYTFASRATQYQQIANPKSELRYGNGGDTVTLISRRRLESIEKVRTAIEVALGWHLAAEFGALSIEAFMSIPQSDVFDDAPWRQYYTGLRMSLGYQWVPE